MYENIHKEILTNSFDTLEKFKRKKVAIVANSTWNIYNFRSNVVKALLENEAELIIIAPIDEYIPHLKELGNITIVPLKRLKRNGINPVNDLKLFLEIYRIYKQYKPDVILHYTIKPNMYGAIASGLLGIANTCVVTGLGYTFIHKGWINTLVKSMYRFAFKFADRVLFENLEDKALFETEHLIERHKSFHIKGCGVDLNYFKPRPEKPEEEDIRFTFIGRLLYDKGIVEFVSAAKIIKKKYPSVQFTVVGFLDDENPAHILRSELLDWISNGIIQYHSQTEDVRPYINSSSCVVLPSYREGLPRVMMEAMAMAKPIITTKTAGCREMVNEGINGFLVDVKDIHALAEAMANIIKCSSANRFKMGLYSRQMAEKEFDDKLIANLIITGLAQYV